jgi:5-methylthioadenosine/S-adenosylhomocysteine deaminase
MVDGEFLVRNNKVLTMDETAILREADAVSRRIWSQVGPVQIPRLPRPV